MRAQTLHALVRLGRTERVEAALAEMDERTRDTAPVRTVMAALALAGDDPEAASAALAPALDTAFPAPHRIWLVEALLFEAMARDALADGGAVQRALERALDLAEPGGVLFPFMVHPVQRLLERHLRSGTSHRSLAAGILDLIAGRAASLSFGEGERLREPLSESELRALRYLPTNLTVREIADELYVSAHTIKTRVKHIYGKLGVHGRAEAVERGRALGLLAPSSRRR